MVHQTESSPLSHGVESESCRKSSAHHGLTTRTLPFITILLFIGYCWVFVSSLTFLWNHSTTSNYTHNSPSFVFIEAANICYTISSTDPTVCSGNGTCIALNTCQCYPGYSGKFTFE